VRHYFTHLTIDIDIALLGMEDTNARYSTGCVFKRKYLCPGNTERFMKQEKNSWTKSHAVVLDTYTDNSIIVSELLKTDGARDISIVCDLSSEKFFPFFPTSNLIGRPHDDGPETQNGHNEREKYFHRGIIRFMVCIVKKSVFTSFFLK
jgi:hypothetical protein